MSRPPVALFVAGRGGSPKRHSVLTSRLEQAGLQVIAPEFGMMQGLHPTMEDLLQRIDLIGSSLSGLSPDTRIFGI